MKWKSKKHFFCLVLTLKSHWMGSPKYWLITPTMEPAKNMITHPLENSLKFQLSMSVSSNTKYFVISSTKWAMSFCGSPARSKSNSSRGERILTGAVRGRKAFRKKPCSPQTHPGTKQSAFKRAFDSREAFAEYVALTAILGKVFWFGFWMNFVFWALFNCLKEKHEYWFSSTFHFTAELCLVASPIT